MKAWRLCLCLLLMICLTPLARAEEDDFLFGTPSPIASEGAQATAEPAQPETDQPVDQGENAPSGGNVMLPTGQEAAQIPGAIEIIISAGGDVTLGRDTRKNADIFGDELKKQGGDLAFPFRNVRELFGQDDLTIVNFEGTLTNTKSATENRFSFGSPPEHVQVLHLGNIEAVALENNHMMDHGQQGLTDTQNTLREAGVVFSGFGEKGYFTVKDVKIGMLSYQTFDGRYDSIYANMPGSIEQLRSEGCDLVIVSYHWGAEREYKPNDRQQGLGRATIDAGADLVLGHHSHCLQPIERYNGKYIVYSLGNFAFAGNTRPEDFDTIIFQQRFLLSDQGVSDGGVRIVPCSISSNRQYNDFTPTPYEEEEARRVAEKLYDNGKNLPYGLADYPLDWEIPALVQ